ncbi:MAG TPA: hypothetical protein VK211_08290 [Kamptonema sp.]|nr:hypothetical protein [Kamptonema sp.]
MGLDNIPGITIEIVEETLTTYYLVLPPKPTNDGEEYYKCPHPFPFH